MIKNLFIILTSLVLITSCQEDVISVQSSDEQKDTVSPYNIPLDSALSYLDDFLKENSNLVSRSDHYRKVVDAYPVKNISSIKSRSGAADCENIIYVANFADESGYAILAADNRISEKVIAVTEEGSMNPGIMYAAQIDPNESEDQPDIYNDYPLTGPGFVTDPESDELFMNPNTVSLYIEEENDTLIGDFRDDDLDAEDENGNPIPNSSNSPNQNMQLLTANLCLNYAINEINGDGGNGDDDGGNSDEDEDDDNGGDPEKDHNGGSGSPNPTKPNRTEITNSPWETTKIVNPILSRYVYWHQRSPFNDLYPKRRKYIIFGHRRKAPAGCFPLALAKIMTHFKSPTSYTFNGTTVNWDALRNSFMYGDGKSSAATLLKGISEGLDSWYFYGGTFSFPQKVTSYMRHIGIRNSHSKGYKFSLVTEMIDKGLPMIMYSVPSIRVWQAHAWNIDGYKIKRREVVTTIYKDYKIESQTKKTETSEMVHCDFGWQGDCNGYYVSGIFRLNHSSADLDGPKTDDRCHYNNLLKIITYDR